MDGRWVDACMCAGREDEGKWKGEEVEGEGKGGKRGRYQAGGS